MNGMVRIVVCIDLPTEDPVEAYRMLYEQMTKLSGGVEWETSDEWYDAAGDPMLEAVVQAARDKVLGTVGAGTIPGVDN